MRGGSSHCLGIPIMAVIDEKKVGPAVVVQIGRQALGSRFGRQMSVLGPQIPEPAAPEYLRVALATMVALVGGDGDIQKPILIKVRYTAAIASPSG